MTSFWEIYNLNRRCCQEKGQQRQDWETAVTVPGVLEPAGLAFLKGVQTTAAQYLVPFFYFSLFLFLFTLCSHSYFLVFLFSLGLMSGTYCHISKNVPCLDCNINSAKRLVAGTTKKVCGRAQLWEVYVSTRESISTLRGPVCFHWDFW